jgi:glyoxylate/hydroxypyruvate/2-ketogluconate reductase
LWQPVLFVLHTNIQNPEGVESVTKPNIIVYKKVEPAVLEYLAETCTVTYFEKLTDVVYPSFLSALKEAEGLLGGGLKVDRALLEQAPRLRIVCNTSVGYDNLDMEELKQRGIVATNTPEVLNETVADTVIALMLAAARRIPELDAAVRKGLWGTEPSDSWYGVDVHHKTLGIIGMGGIGNAIAQRAKFGFGMNILYHNRSRKPEAEERFGAQYCGMDELLGEADFVCLMTPLTPSTAGLIGKRELSLMKPSAIFINGSRGATVDEEALVEALEKRTIHAAGLDVFVEEPLPGDHPLTRLDNVVLAPHIGSATGETRFKMAMLAAENLTAFMQGQTPPTVIR